MDGTSEMAHMYSSEHPETLHRRSARNQSHLKVGVCAGIVASKFCVGMDDAANDWQETQSCCTRPSCRGHVKSITFEITIPGSWLRLLPIRESYQGGSSLELFRLTDGGLFALIQRCTKEALTRALPMSTRDPDPHPDPAYGVQPLLVTVPREWMKAECIPVTKCGDVIVLESPYHRFPVGVNGNVFQELNDTGARFWLVHAPCDELLRRATLGLRAQIP